MFMAACHSGLRWKKPLKIGYVFAQRVAIGTPAARAWFDFITGPLSPWMSACPPLYINRTNGTLLWDHTCAMPARPFFNFLVACRFSSECHMNLVHQHVWWYRLIRRGIDPRVAFVFLSLFNFDEGQDKLHSKVATQHFRFTFVSGNAGHAILGGRSTSVQNVQKFLNAECPGADDPPFFKDPHVAFPNAYMWEGPNTYQKLVEDLYGGPPATMKEFYEMARKENERLLSA